MLIDVISIFPQMFNAITEYGITGRAIKRGLCTLCITNPRDFAKDNYHRIDDKPYGGGGGMVMQAEPLQLALAACITKTKSARVNNVQHTTHHNEQQPKLLRIYLSPQGQTLTQELVNTLATDYSQCIIVCGRYEGVDERFIAQFIDLEISLGDFVVSGGELPAMMLIDAIIRQLPNAVDESRCIKNDSFMNGLLDYPSYTTPRVFAGMEVPAVLLSGNHQQIELWRLKMGLWRTYQRRPDLLAKRTLSELETALLASMLQQNE